MGNRRPARSEGIANDRNLTLQATGITLLGVLLSIGVTVAFGLKAAWWVRSLPG